MLGGVWARLVAEGLTRLVCRVFGLIKFKVNAEAAESAEIAEKEFYALRAYVATTEYPGCSAHGGWFSSGPQAQYNLLCDLCALCGLCVNWMQGATGSGAAYSRLIRSDLAL
jgi:hypothetical protein